MPLNVRRFFASVSFVLLGSVVLSAQTTPTPAPTNAPVTTPVAPVNAPTSAEVMRERISKAKAFIAVKNYNAAIYELENIRRETKDQSVHGVLNVLLMNSYLEQSDYKRAQDFLKELYNPQKSAKPNPSNFYFAVAAQVVKGARNQFERYRSLGLTVSDRNLPLEATVDVEKMRETLELVIDQSKNIGADKNKTADSLALLEEAMSSRRMIARDDYDSKRWKDEVGDTREQLTNSRSVVFNAVNDTPTELNKPFETAVASNTPMVSQETKPSVPNETVAVFNPVSTEKMPEMKPVVKEEPTKVDESKTAAQNEPKQARDRVIPTKETPTKETAPPVETVANDGSPLKMGSLLEFATKQTKPVYPAAARTIRQTGVVRVEVVVDESGEVAEVQNTSGPSMLQSAAKDAVKKWRFKPFTRDGQPVKAHGYVSFNFAL